jgi:hypothetical protein
MVLWLHLGDEVFKTGGFGESHQMMFVDIKVSMKPLSSLLMDNELVYFGLFLF